MEITILGTAAAEAWPAIFCACSTCLRARSAGGKNIRSRASIMIGENHKIDYPPDGFYHEAIIGADMSKLRHIFFTHTHGDHFDIKELTYFMSPFAHENESRLYTWGSECAAAKLSAKFNSGSSKHPIEVMPLEPFVTVSADDLLFTPITAKHMENEECFNYIVSDGEKNFLYTCDTGLYDEPTWEYLSGVKLDLVISECTNGTKYRSDTHMSFDGVLEMIRKLTSYGTLSGSSRVVLTHFSHNMGLLHEEFEEIARPYGIRIAYDGMKVAL